MASLNKSTFFRSLLSYLPIILLFFSVFNEFDFNYLKLDYFSFNFIFISSTALTTIENLLPVFLPFFSPGKRFFANFTNFLILHGYYSQ